MSELFSPTLIIVTVISIGIGAGIGVGLLLMIQRSQTGGKSLDDLRQEQQAYQKDVDAHFEQTAVLFKNMTEDYRKLYEHMASGAQKLCQGEPVIQALEFPRTAALTQSIEAPNNPDKDSEPATNTARTQPVADEREAPTEVSAEEEAIAPEEKTPAATPSDKSPRHASSPQDVLNPPKPIKE